MYKTLTRTCVKQVKIACQLTYPSTILQFGDGQNSTLYIHHVTSNCNAECLQVWVIVELGFSNLSHIRTDFNSQHNKSTV